MQLYPQTYGADENYINYQKLWWESSSRMGAPQNKPKRAISEPILLWKKEYESNPAALLRVFQEVSDAMLFKGPALYHKNNPNQPYLIEATKGNLRATDYQASEYAFGERTNTILRDNHFYYSAKTYLTTQATSAPFEFTVKNINNEYSEKQRKYAAKQASKIASNLFAEYGSDAGTDVSFLYDEKVNMSGSRDEILERLKGNDKLDYIITQLIKDIDTRHSFTNLAKKAFSSKFDVNAQFSIIEVINGDIRPRYLRPDQVLWLSGKEDIETLEDDSVVAASAVDYLTFTEIMHKYGMDLNTGTGAAGIIDAMDKLRKGSLPQYNPNHCYFTEYYRATASTSDVDYAGPDSLPVWNQINYNNVFYPTSQTSAGLELSLLEQKGFVKMIVPTRYRVEINGKPATDALMKKWRETDYKRELFATFEEVDPEKKPEKGQYVIDKPKIELWEFTRLGHGTLLGIGRYKYTAGIRDRNGYVGMPIIGQICYDKSLALLGYTFAIWTNIISKGIEEIISQLGLNTAILFDEATGGDPLSFLYNAKKSGIAIFNSNKTATYNGRSPLQHLGLLKLGNHVEEISRMLQMIGTFKIMYETMVGASPQAQGVPQDYSGFKETAQNVANQGILSQEVMWQNNKFMTQNLQRCADVARVLNAKDEFVNISLSKGQKEILKLTRDLENMTPDVYLFYGYDMQRKNEKIYQAVTQAMASGGIDMIEELIEVLVTDNPYEVKAIFSKSKEKLMAAREAEMQRQVQQARYQAQADQQKNQIPLQVANTKGQYDIEVQKLKMQERAESDDIKGHMSDIKHQEELENKEFDSDLRREEETHRAALDFAGDNADENY